MDIEIENLEIDNYVNWFHVLSYKVNSYQDNKAYMNRLIYAAYRLHVRALFDDKAKVSKTLAKVFEKKAQVIESELDKVAHYADERFRQMWLFPDSSEWGVIYSFRKIGLEEDIEDFNKKINNSITPKIDTAKRILADVIKDRPLKLLDFYLNTQVIANDDGMSLMWFYTDLNTIDYIKYLHKQIAKLGKKQGTPPQKVIELTPKNLALDEIALICYYNNREVTRANAQSISNEYGNPANSNVLYNKYNYCKYAPNRTGTDTEIKVSNRLKKMERIKLYIKDKELFNRELIVLRKNANEAFPLTFPI